MVDTDVIPEVEPTELVDENPAQSIKQILDQRMIQVTPAEPKAIIEGLHPYRRAVGNGVVAAVLVLLLIGTIFLIKSLG